MTKCKYLPQKKKAREKVIYAITEVGCVEANKDFYEKKDYFQKKTELKERRNCSIFPIISFI